MLNTCLLYYSNLTKTIPLYIIKWLIRKVVLCTFCLLCDMLKERTERLEHLDQDQQEHESQLYKRSERYE